MPRIEQTRPVDQPNLLIAGCSFSGLAMSEAWFIALAMTGLVGFLATVAWMIAGE